MGAPEDKAFSQESASEQVKSRFSGKSFALITLVCAIAIALTAFAIINNPGISTIADDSNPMASGEDVDPGEPNKYGEIDEDTISVIYDKEPCVGTQEVAYYATEGGTLTFNPNDDPNIAVKEDIVIDPSPIELFGSGYGVQTGLKEYKSSIAVNPTVCFGSITAVPDPGYSFVSWNNGENYSPKLYIWGAMRGTAIAYFEKDAPAVNIGSGASELTDPEVKIDTESDTGDKADPSTEPETNNKAASSTESETSDKADSPVASDTTNNNANDNPALPAMRVYAQNALNGKITLAQGESMSLSGFAVLTQIDYAGAITGKVKYESSNTNIASVNGSGKVFANKKKTGTARITIYSVDNPDCAKVVSVKVVSKAKYRAAKKIEKLNLKKQYKANAKKQIAVKVLKWNPKAPTNKNFAVSVSPDSKASVDPTTNKITFKAKGTVKVTVKSAADPKVKKTVKIKVN